MAETGAKTDVLVIGGGATGTSVALDAATRGLSVVLVERGDFGCETSSKSTKLVHGGVRYLEKAVKNVDWSQLSLVFEALHERKRLLRNAEYLSQPLAIMTPCYRLWEVPYFWAGLKVYDVIAGVQGLTLSRFLSAKESKRCFPTLAQKLDGNTLQGTVVYYDGQFDDARLCLMLGITAAYAGATVLNYTSADALVRDKAGAVTGARIRDVLTGDTVQVEARRVVNATGVFVDELRGEHASSVVRASSGAHITLPDYYSPDHMGLVVPKTKDGRVVFMLPWHGHTIAGTTDTPCHPERDPRATEEDIRFILDSIAPYLVVEARRSDVLSAWSGLRALAGGSGADSTEGITRDHVIHQDKDGLVTVAGGKWTTCRRIGEDVVDALGLEGKPCQTMDLDIVGNKDWSPTTFTEIAQSYTVPHRPGSIDIRVAKHLSRSYGSRAFDVIRIAEDRKLGRRIVRGMPIIEAEVVHAVQSEYCLHITDFIARRTRLQFLDTLAAKDAVTRVAQLMAEELGWSKREQQRQIDAAHEVIRKYTVE